MSVSSDSFQNGGCRFRFFFLIFFGSFEVKPCESFLFNVIKRICKEGSDRGEGDGVEIFLWMLLFAFPRRIGFSLLRRDSAAFFLNIELSRKCSTESSWIPIIGIGFHWLKKNGKNRVLMLFLMLKLNLRCSLSHCCLFSHRMRALEKFLKIFLGLPQFHKIKTNLKYCST